MANVIDINSEMREFSNTSFYKRKTEFLKVTVPGQAFRENYIDIAHALEGCSYCPNFCKSWTCPSHDFDLKAFWEQFETIELYAAQIFFDKEYVECELAPEIHSRLMEEVMTEENELLTAYARAREEQVEGSFCLKGAGPCNLCKSCTRPEEKPCRFPDKIRYSIESLGIDVGKCMTDLFGIELLWASRGQLPAYMTFVTGLAIKP